MAYSGQPVPSPQPRTPKPDSLALSALIQVHVFEFVSEGKAHSQNKRDHGKSSVLSSLFERIHDLERT